MDRQSSDSTSLTEDDFLHTLSPIANAVLEAESKIIDQLDHYKLNSLSINGMYQTDNDGTESEGKQKYGEPGEGKDRALTMSRASSTERKRAEIKTAVIAAELRRREIRDSVQYRSCCGCRIDSRAVGLLSQVIMIGMTFIFCIVQLIRVNSCEETQTYIGLLTFLLGLIIPVTGPPSRNMFSDLASTNPIVFTTNQLPKQ